MEAGVARSWRLRHKLMLGLALVVASIALLLGGAVFGLSSFVDASRTTEHKLRLIHVVVILRDHVHMMSVPPEVAANDGTPQLQRERTWICYNIAEAQKDAAVYRKTMDDGKTLGDADPDEGAGERQLLDSIEKHLAAMKMAVEATRASNSSPSGPDIRVIDESSVRGTYDRLSAKATELFNLNKNHIDAAQDRGDRPGHVAGEADGRADPSVGAVEVALQDDTGPVDLAAGVLRLKPVNHPL